LAFNTFLKTVRYQATKAVRTTSEKSNPWKGCMKKCTHKETRYLRKEAGQHIESVRSLKRETPTRLREQEIKNLGTKKLKK
jgi:hypothetical protein